MAQAKTQTIEIDTVTAAALERHASARGQSVSQVVAELVAHVGTMAETGSGQIAELERRWDRFQKQTETASHDQVVRWLDTWGTAAYGPRPGARPGS